MKRICVLIPAYNESLVIGPTIKSLINSGFDPDSIYVVDDCSSDDTSECAREFTAKVARLSVNSGKALAQAYAIEYFNLVRKYDYVVMLDCDSTVGPNFKEVIHTYAYRHPDVDLFVGQVKNAKTSNVISALRTVEYTFSHEIVKKGQHNFGVIYVAPGCASVYSTRVLNKLHFDPTTLAEDMDLTLQVHELGGKVMYIHGAEVITQDPQTLADYNKQITRWFRGFWQIVDKYSIFRVGLHSRVTLYMLYIILDTLLANRILTAFVAAFLMPLQFVLLGVAIDFAIFFCITAYAAFKTKRYAICLKSPLLYLLQFFNAYAFMRSFFEVIVFRKKAFKWNKVARYKE